VNLNTFPPEANLKIALTGSTSTGKTTLAKALMTVPLLKIKLNKTINVDARSLVAKMGFSNMNSMSIEETRYFQHFYFDTKVGLERLESSFLAERSFVDVAAYWLERDSIGLQCGERDDFLSRCRTESVKYDLHIYLPFGVIPFEQDGHRSGDMSFHRRIDDRIQHLLVEWNLANISVPFQDLTERISAVSNWLLR
jgi:nicotinamide riboside kinase